MLCVSSSVPCWFNKVFFALTITAIGVSQTSAMAPDSNKAKDSAASIFDILDSKPKIDSSSDEGTTLQNVNGDIEFRHVSFRYPMRPDVQIFRDLCLNIPSGKTVALVGESGSGKSTVISMIERFYNPDSGMILIDQVEIQTFKLSWLRQQMGLVSQEPVLFNETIRSNIAYGKTGGATEEEIISAAQAANAHNFISSLPQGYETSVGERGVQLSGGQKQRIAIARAILKDPKILLLDEATSALDAESERVVQDALDRVMVNRTTVVVAHRLTTIKNADVIAVVKNGVIAEKGRHETLMKISGGPSILSDAWLAVQGPGDLHMGSTWEWQSRNHSPDVSAEEASRALAELLPKASAVYPEIDKWEFAGARAGLRAMPPVTSHGSLPLLGCVDQLVGAAEGGSSKFWVFGGLGSRGLLYHGWLGKLIAKAVLCCKEELLPSELTSWKINNRVKS
ncbi:hypothetical protein F2Q68_00037115 [Brassica cretica]|uniref:ABC transporter domain-containing protein n=1 Tax=Brassica cretica TaxID=69181 RepID=A0A8S9GVW9_BRACR|nr:hypothetical protein F2Q68_00037115 [Brassica cretica]